MLLSTITPFIPAGLLYLKISLLNRGNKVCNLKESNFCLIANK